MKHDPTRWKSDYERDGYLVVPDCLDSQTLASLRKGIEWISKDPDNLPPHLRRWIDLERNYVKSSPQHNEFTAEQVGNAIRNIMELPIFAPMFAELICYQPLAEILEVLFDSSEFRFHNYKCIIKAPKISSKFIWHRDLPYLNHTSPNLLTAMLCLDEMTEANGATVVFPGSHRIPHEQVTAADVDIPEAKLPPGERVMVKCPAGSAVIFHVNIVHGGGANRSEIPRRNVIGIWEGPDTYPVDPHRYAYQDLMPASRDPNRIKQIRMTFPRLFPPAVGNKEPAVGNSANTRP